MIVCTDPLPNERVPISVARLWSCNAPATISEAEADEGSGSQSYVPPDPKDDKVLHLALDLLRGVQSNPAFPPMQPRARAN